MCYGQDRVSRLMCPDKGITRDCKTDGDKGVTMGSKTDGDKGVTMGRKTDGNKGQQNRWG